MTSPAAPFRAAQTAALRASAALTAAMGGKMNLFAKVPTGQPAPYAVNGEDQVLLDASGCATEAEIYSTVHVWARDPDLARAMGAAIIAALDLALAVAGHEVVDWGLEAEHYSTDPDGSTHGRLEFHYLTTEIVA